MAICAYCGCPTASTSDHVFPRGLFGKLTIGQANLITVPACVTCNNEAGKHEVLFRNVIAMSGLSNTAVRDLWNGKMTRGFAEVDGKSRAQELISHMRPVTELPGQYMLFPAEVPEVVRIVRKIARGLCRYHDLLTSVSDDQVFADVLRFEIPDEFLDAMTLHHVHHQVAQYRYMMISEFGMHSAWLIEFFNRTPFICIVYESVAARRAAEGSTIIAA